MSKIVTTDYLIIGQGLAGTILAHCLIQRNQSVQVMDEFRPTTSSRVAGGLFHPVTGRRIVKSWMVETLYPFAQKFYGDQEKLLHSAFFFPKDLIEILSSPHEFNIWSERLADPGLNQYLSSQPDQKLYIDKLKDFFKMIALSGTGWMDIARYLEVSLQYFAKLNILQSGKFILENLKFGEDGIVYENIHAKKIIFCEGSDALLNPLWNWIPFQPSKGEILTISAPALPEDHILLKGLLLIPIGNHRFRVGSTYTWEYDDELPTEAGKNELARKLKEIIAVPFDILDHKSAVRPTTKDRRPILGEHPEIKNAWIFNGLGTKGVLLGPYFANELSEFLINQKEINSEVDISRFHSVFEQSR
jgi:glycine/D-amino acid oxidase-like deaminating enzyme